ncbi:MAG: SRPBCC family protein [Acidimicrobiia bacterium]|nr:SRPBCC family protein [Acidimicrobiia bacterium]
MADVEVSVIIDRTPEQVWDYVRDISTHVEWMVDAVEIRFLGSRTAGEGTTFECDTKVGPVKLVDVMTVTSWIDGREMGVRHEGVVTGEGVFRLSPFGAGATEFSWRESLRFPWWMGSRIGAKVSGPVLAAIWRRNLAELKRRVEAVPVV